MPKLVSCRSPTVEPKKVIRGIRPLLLVRPTLSRIEGEGEGRGGSERCRPTRPLLGRCAGIGRRGRRCQEAGDRDVTSLLQYWGDAAPPRSKS